MKLILYRLALLWTRLKINYLNHKMTRLGKRLYRDLSKNGDLTWLKRHTQSTE